MVWDLDAGWIMSDNISMLISFVVCSRQHFFLRAESRYEYLHVYFIEEAFLIGIFKDHVELIWLPEVSVHFEDVGMIHEEL